MNSEKILKQKANRLLKKYGKFIPYNSYPYGEPGTPDKIGCINGRMILIEFKKEGGKPKPLQKLRKKEWESAGATVWIIHTIDELRKKLEKEAINAKEKK